MTMVFNVVMHFNSQPHEEADPPKQTAQNMDSISTHSLTKRLTDHGYADCQRVRYFNSQPHEEADNSLLHLFSPR